MLPTQTKRWQIGSPAPQEVLQALNAYPPVFCQVLFNRGITTMQEAENYLRPEEHEGHDPNLLMRMPEAVERILYAIDHREQITVYGDYDVDGVTSTALLVEVLECLGARVDWYIPNRFDEGYGLNSEALRDLAARGVDLVITVDCGIRSPREADEAAQLGVDLIITDHHHPGPELPTAAAVLCPKQEGDSYPDKELAGVGLAFKLAQALLSRRPVNGRRAEDWLDLVALGTVSDVVPLRGENRRLVRMGLARLRQCRRQGVLSLAGAARLNLESVTAGDVGFILGPRLNAAGRMDSALDSLRLLLERDPLKSGLMAQKLDNQNRERQDLTRKIQEAAIQMAQEAEQAEIIFAFSAEFSSGVVGLAASRLVDTYYRPAVVGHIEEGQARASCRSIPEFHITQALDECRELLERHGGHSVAAGFTVNLENLDSLKSRLAEIARRELGGRELVPVLQADAEIVLDSLRPEVFRYLEMLEPTGQANPVATFVSRGVRLARPPRTVGAEGQHLKLSLTGGGVTYDAIAFRQGHWAQRMPEHIDVLYTFEKNVFNGVTTMQLNVKDLQAS